MAHEKITNEDFWTIDFAEADRKKSLRSLSRKLSSIPPRKSQYMYSTSVWMTDVSATDKRSVKAQLAGRGDYRALWWAACSRCIHILAPGATLEERMFRFHSLHHKLTLFRLQTIEDFREVFMAIKREGIIAGLRCTIAQAKRPDQEQL
jgi:hypothetical protein